MRQVYGWRGNYSFGCNLAINKIAPFFDKLHALHDPETYRRNIAAIYPNWHDAPGSIMLEGDVKPHERDDALRSDFVPIARYVVKRCVGEPDAIFDEKRHMRIVSFAVEHAVDTDRDLWADDVGKPYRLEELLPFEASRIMLHRWFDQPGYHGDVSRLLQVTLA